MAGSSNPSIWDALPMKHGEDIPKLLAGCSAVAEGHARGVASSSIGTDGEIGVRLSSFLTRQVGLSRVLYMPEFFSNYAGSGSPDSTHPTKNGTTHPPFRLPTQVTSLTIPNKISEQCHPEAFEKHSTIYPLHAISRDLSIPTGTSMPIPARISLDAIHTSSYRPAPRSGFFADDVDD